MNSYEIEKFIENNKIKVPNLKHFKGVFASNYLTKIKLKKNQSIIINSCNFPQATMNCHWCLCLNDGKNIYWFDSFGGESYKLKKSINSFVEKHNKPIKYNKIRIQNVFSVKCGQFCCIFLFLYYKNKMKIPQLKKIFDINNLRYNDKILDKIFILLKSV